MNNNKIISINKKSFIGIVVMLELLVIFEAVITVNGLVIALANPNPVPTIHIKKPKYPSYPK